MNEICHSGFIRVPLQMILQVSQWFIQTMQPVQIWDNLVHLLFITTKQFTAEAEPVIQTESFAEVCQILSFDHLI